jgi:catechol 2,3-dioxygenase-like lactoylglutathione lyase family enzyme
MTETKRVYKIHPDRQRWTHLAFAVKDIDASIAWYEKHTHLEFLARREDEFGYGAWLGDRTQADEPFLLVLSQFFDGQDPFAPVEHPPLGPFAHIGIEVTAREMIDEIAALAKKEGCLALGPEVMPPPVGYICFIRDPDGNVLEFSFDQGVYQTAKEVWGSK